MARKLENKVALITGGNSGIGRATATLFAREGAVSVIAARNHEKGDETAHYIEETGGTALFLPLDVREPANCQQVVKTVIERFGRIDILFNNAGIVPFGTVPETSLEIWREVWETNVSGVFYMSRAVLPHMIYQRSGVIINNGSDVSVVGAQRTAAYSATKGAVAQLTKSMALDHARQGIRVNAVCPGDTYVERWDRRKSPNESKDEFLKHAGDPFPMGRVGKPEEIAKVVLFLASDDASYMTGQLVVVDGGHTAGGTSERYDSSPGRIIETPST
ncbi:MAG: glucose 1-dehydrogenase [Anaerolineae bacterium]|nr:glucose 1-dehydrogenase [Anaerolineae bacterium]